MSALAVLMSAMVLQAAPYGPIACVYDALSPAQRRRVDVQNIDSASNLKLLEPPMTRCATAHKWPAELGPVVVEYTIGRIAGERLSPGPEQKKHFDEARRMEEAWKRLTPDG